MVSLAHAGWDANFDDHSKGIKTFETRFIDLGPPSMLTKCEVEVLVLLGNGLSVPQVAKWFHRSPTTIDQQESAINQKLRLSGQAELVMTVNSIGMEVIDAHLTRYTSKA